MKSTTLGKISCLIQSNLLRCDKCHSVLEIQVTLAVEVEALICCLYDAFNDVTYLESPPNIRKF